MAVSTYKRIKDEVGKKYGRLSVLTFDGTDQKGRAMWICKCDCGNEVVTRGSNLRRGAVKSCGCLVGSNRLQWGEASFNKLFSRFKRTAKKRGYIWELTREQVRVLTSQDCYYCGTEPSQVASYGYGNYIHGGIDRVDNSLGYTEDNCVPCCGNCNRAKYTMSVQEFKIWVDRVCNHMYRNDWENKLLSVLLSKNVRAVDEEDYT